MTTQKTDRRPATQEDIVVGARVFKGNGNTLYRVWATHRLSSGLMASVVKATTEKDPVRGCFYGWNTFTVPVDEQPAPESAPMIPMIKIAREVIAGETMIKYFAAFEGNVTRDDRPVVTSVHPYGTDHVKLHLASGEVVILRDTASVTIEALDLSAMGDL